MWYSVTHFCLSWLRDLNEWTSFDEDDSSEKPSTKPSAFVCSFIRSSRYQYYGCVVRAVRMCVVFTMDSLDCSRWQKPINLKPSDSRLLVELLCRHTTHTHSLNSLRSAQSLGQFGLTCCRRRVRNKTLLHLSHSLRFVFGSRSRFAPAAGDVRKCGRNYLFNQRFNVDWRMWSWHMKSECDSQQYLRNVPTHW